MAGTVAATRTHLLLGRSYLLRMAVVAVIFVPMSIWMGSPILMILLTAFIATMLGMYLAGLLVGPTAVGRYFASTGYRRRAVVDGLFGASLATLVTGVLVMIGIALLIGLTPFEWKEDLGSLAPMIGLGIAVALAFFALGVPLSLKFGPERARLYVLVPMAAVMAALPMINDADLFAWIASAGTVTVTAAAIGAGLVLVAVAWFASVRIYAQLDV